MSLVVGGYYVRVVLKDYYTANKNTVEWLRVEVVKNNEGDGDAYLVRVFEEQFFNAAKALYIPRPSSNYPMSNQFLYIYRYYSDGSLRIDNAIPMLDKNETPLHYPFIYQGDDIQSFGASSFTNTAVWHSFHRRP